MTVLVPIEHCWKTFRVFFVIKKKQISNWMWNLGPMKSHKFLHVRHLLHPLHRSLVVQPLWDIQFLKLASTIHWHRRNFGGCCRTLPAKHAIERWCITRSTISVVHGVYKQTYNWPQCRREFFRVTWICAKRGNKSQFCQSRSQFLVDLPKKSQKIDSSIHLQSQRV